MRRPQRLLPDEEKSLVHQLRVVVSGLADVKTREILQDDARRCGLGTVDPLIAPERPLIERFRLGESSLERIEPGQIVQAGNHVGVVAPERALADLERSLIERFRLGEITAAGIEHGQRIQAGREPRVAGPEALGVRNGATELGLRLDILSLLGRRRARRRLPLPGPHLSASAGEPGHQGDERHRRPPRCVVHRLRPLVCAVRGFTDREPPAQPRSLSTGHVLIT